MKSRKKVGKKSRKITSKRGKSESKPPVEEPAAPAVGEVLYKVVDFELDQSAEQLEMALNELGANEWQLTQIVGRMGGLSIHAIFIKAV